MRKTLMVLIAAPTLLAGCGQGESGVAQPVAERWDPCSIPKDAIEATGLDPSYKDVGWGEGIVVKDWSLCTFRGPAVRPTYFFNMKSADTHTIDEARRSPSNLDGLDLAIGDHDGFRFKTNVAKSVRDCNIAVAVPPGVVVFTVNSMGTTKIDADLCDLVFEHAVDLAPLLPASGK